MDLKPFFEPQTMAVFGVSSHNDRHPANEIFSKNLLRYPIRVYGVNPRGGTIEGQPILKSIAAAPEPVDLAVIAVRAEGVPEIMAECIAARVRAAVVISGGFKEAGRPDLQEQIVTLAAEASFPFIGPNCLGVYSPSRVDTFFLPAERMVTPAVGKVSLVSQSGGILVDQMIKFTSEGVGIAKAVSVGNKALLGELELFDYLAADPATQVLAFYIEGFRPNEGRAFVLKARSCSKPVVVLKAGKSPGGSKAVSSHTASLAGNYASFSAVLAQHGVIEAANELEFVSFCESLENHSRSIRGRVGIITVSGGHGALAADACAAHGIEVPALAEPDQAALRQRLQPSVRPIASLVNPIDLTGSAVDEDFIAAVQGLLESDAIDSILTLLLPYVPGITTDLGAKLGSLARRAGKPLIAYVPHVEKYAMLIEGFALNGAPVSPSIEGAVLMVKALQRQRPQASGESFRLTGQPVPL